MIRYSQTIQFVVRIHVIETSDLCSYSKKLDPRKGKMCKVAFEWKGYFCKNIVQHHPARYGDRKPAFVNVSLSNAINWHCIIRMFSAGKCYQIFAIKKYLGKTPSMICFAFTEELYFPSLDILYIFYVRKVFSSSQHTSTFTSNYS